MYFKWLKYQIPLNHCNMGYVICNETTIWWLVVMGHINKKNMLPPNYFKTSNVIFNWIKLNGIWFTVMQWHVSLLFYHNWMKILLTWTFFIFTPCLLELQGKSQVYFSSISYKEVTGYHMCHTLTLMKVKSSQFMIKYMQMECT